MNGEWVRVTQAKPCPICRKPDWCGVSADGVWVVCMRVEGARSVRNGGWLHRLGDAPALPVRRAPVPVRPQMLNCAEYHAALRLSWDWRMCEGLAMTLGVDMEALEALRPAWDPMADAFAFPMRDGAGAVVGIRLRAYDGRKWAVRGSREGLFYDADMGPTEELVVCEGPTDTAAARSLGLPAVGRPSCQGCVFELAVLVRRLRCQQVTIIADHDEPKRGPDGTSRRPGWDGARELGKRLRRMSRIVVPPAKDIRAWLCAGATRVEFDALASSAAWRAS